MSAQNNLRRVMGSARSMTGATRSAAAQVQASKYNYDLSYLGV